MTQFNVEFEVNDQSFEAEFSDFIGTPITAQQYVVETMDSDNYVVAAEIHGYNYIRNNIFTSCPRLATIQFNGTESGIGNHSFNGCTSLNFAALPSTTRTIGQYAFFNNTSLQLNSFPNLTSIDDYAFYNCTSLGITEIPASITRVGIRAFASCTGITSLTFKGTPTTIDYLALASNSIQHIYVPWGQGAVSGAPWGATAATIHYNSQV